MSNVIPLPERGPTACLARAVAADLDTIIIVGWTKDGQFWSDATVKDGGDTLWLLEMAKKALMEAE